MENSEGGIRTGYFAASNSSSTFDASVTEGGRKNAPGECLRRGGRIALVDDVQMMCIIIVHNTS